MVSSVFLCSMYGNIPAYRRREELARNEEHS